MFCGDTHLKKQGQHGWLQSVFAELLLVLFPFFLPPLLSNREYLHMGQMELDGDKQRVQGQSHSHQLPGGGDFSFFLAVLTLFPIACRSRYYSSSSKVTLSPGISCTLSGKSTFSNNAVLEELDCRVQLSRPLFTSSDNDQSQTQN